MKISLYEATYSAALENFIEDGTGEIDIAGFEAAQITVTDKQLAYAAVIKNEGAGIDMIDNAIKQLQSKKKVKEAQQTRLKEALTSSMKAIGASEIKALNGTFSAKLKIDFDESIEIEDGAVFPLELCNTPKPPEPSKTKIKAAILRGEPIAGASIVRRDRLTIN